MTLLTVIQTPQAGVTFLQRIDRRGFFRHTLAISTGKI